MTSDLTLRALLARVAAAAQAFSDSLSALAENVDPAVVALIEEQIAVAVEQARAKRQLAAGGAACTEASPQPANAGVRDSEVTVCSCCRQSKPRGYFTPDGWGKGVCAACETLAAAAQPASEPTTVEWLSCRDRIPSLHMAIANLEQHRPELRHLRLGDRLTVAHDRYDHVAVEAILQEVYALTAQQAR